MCVCVRDAFLCTYVLDGEQVFFVFILFFLLNWNVRFVSAFPFFLFHLFVSSSSSPFFFIPFFFILCEWFAIHDSISFL